ncbi:Predicted DNA-binding transcriptional regulator YafY, contains an HTH and WYL domains [Ruminococcus sp. YE71]|uniref:helix-turn-helix transcriptional regulator n=1 Tax=unclassified Ruminococcus TaxID=2608920 RepID=UPI000883DCE7|nr:MULTISPECIES: WYL domain-containing protein [unclassified Ruminococcus]SDA29500.1 Predicted DNA-binding transcriptional regulator YafY, contains an HTH and WYL domains [Ruminococcus sp. YE78]SFW48388.1 Predicted DNA-binding transcriptional regulator YafY, contains an HTH and WYL domains [Ruminococcus sp. YE71]
MSELIHKKLRVVKLLEILQQDTDSYHPLATNSLLQRLAELGYTADRRTVARDIEILNAQGYEIMQVKDGKQNAYYIEDRSFSLPELKILIDAVQAASFITDKKSDDLIKKIAALGGSHQAEILTDNIVHFNTRKHTNEHIYYNVSILEQTIRDKQKVAFKYFDLDEKLNKVYRRDGAVYETEPFALVFNNDNYYLMTYDQSADGEVRNYRVDRMDSVEILPDSISKEAKAKIRTVSKYTEQVFRMYGGRNAKVTLMFDKKLIGTVYDKFGEKTKIRKKDEQYQAEVEVQISPTFWSWVVTFNGQMNIAEPQEINAEYRAWIAQLQN